MEKRVSLNEMREQVARLIFGDDWIGSLTTEQHELLRSHLIRRKIQRIDGSGIMLDHIERLPSRLAAKVDQTLGRATRLQAQYVTVDSWLQDRGMFSFAGYDYTQDRKSFCGLIRSEVSKQKKPTAERRRGPRPQILPRVEAEMEKDLAEGQLTHEELATLPDKELEFRYHAKRERVRTARAAILNGDEQYRQMPTKKK